MKKHFSITISKVLLNIILFMLGTSIFALAIGVLFIKSNINGYVYIIMCLLYFFIVKNLRKVVYSIDLTPFCFDNVKRFKKIGFYMIAIAVVDGIANWKVVSNFEFLGTNTGSLKGSFLVYIISACIAFVLAEVFERAVEIKNENDLTI